MSAPETTPKASIARRIGIALQAVLMGTGLFFTLLRLAEISTDAQIFKYQGF